MDENWASFCLYSGVGWYYPPHFRPYGVKSESDLDPPECLTRDQIHDYDNQQLLQFKPGRGLIFLDIIF